MSYATPGISWEAMHADASAGRPAVLVPAELSALGLRERALLEVRLACRCEVAQVVVAAGERGAITFIGPTVELVTAPFRAAADAALASVAADTAAGWTADDERERHRPFAWDA